MGLRNYFFPAEFDQTFTVRSVKPDMEHFKNNPPSQTCHRRVVSARFFPTAHIFIASPSAFGLLVSLSRLCIANGTGIVRLMLKDACLSRALSAESQTDRRGKAAEGNGTLKVGGYALIGDLAERRTHR